MQCEELFKELWRRWGSEEHPAEWDGIVYGGGVMSQRYWEYFMALQMMNLKPSDQVLDMGGGSNKTGSCFFADLLAEVVPVTVLDPEAGRVGKAELIQQKASYHFLKGYLPDKPFTQIACLSVLEHIPDHEQVGIIRGIDEFFEGDKIIFTIEYQAARRFFNWQLTAESLHTVFRNFTRFYPSRIEASPVWCQNAWKRAPAWYPLAILFEKI